VALATHFSANANNPEFPDILARKDKEVFALAVF
jgi:hypothetical protein